MVVEAPLRIAVFSRSLPGHGGGGGMEQLAWNLMTEWVALGHSVTCFTSPYQGVLPENGIHVQILSGPSGVYSREWFRATAKAAEGLEVDVMMGVSAGAHEIAIRRKTKSAIPIVMQAHGTSLDEIITAVSSRTLRSTASAIKRLPGLIRDCRIYKKYDSLIAVGPAIPRSIARYPRVFRPRRIDVVLNGVRSEPQCEPLGSSVIPAAQPKRNGIIFVGRLYREKGADLAIQAASFLGMPLRIVGDGPDRIGLEAIARKLESDVSFTGPVEPHAVQRHLSQAAILVVPSRRREGLPLVVLEGLSAGMPVIVSPQVAMTFGASLPHGVVAMEDLSVEALTNAVSKASDIASAGPIQLPAEFQLASAAADYIKIFRGLQPGLNPAV